MSGRRSSVRQAPTLLRDSASVGQPRGEKFPIQAGEDHEILVAVSTTPSQFLVAADACCVICYERYEESQEVWQVKPCEHIFHFACIGEASSIMIEN